MHARKDAVLGSMEEARDNLARSRDSVGLVHLDPPVDRLQHWIPRTGYVRTAELQSVLVHNIPVGAASRVLVLSGRRHLGRHVEQTRNHGSWSLFPNSGDHRHHCARVHYELRR